MDGGVEPGRGGIRSGRGLKPGGRLGEESPSRQVVVEHDELRGKLAELDGKTRARGDVGEDDLIAFVNRRVGLVVVTSRLVAALLPPRSPDGPGSAESVRAASVVVADPPHRSSVAK